MPTEAEVQSAVSAAIKKPETKKEPQPAAPDAVPSAPAKDSFVIRLPSKGKLPAGWLYKTENGVEVVPALDHAWIYPTRKQATIDMAFCRKPAEIMPYLEACEQELKNRSRKQPIKDQDEETPYR